MKRVKKGDLPNKICLVCNRPFAWRKKWSRDWKNVRYCSERCRRTKKAVAVSANLKPYKSKNSPIE